MANALKKVRDARKILIQKCSKDPTLIDEVLRNIEKIAQERGVSSESLTALFLEIQAEIRWNEISAYTVTH